MKTRSDGYNKDKFKLRKELGKHQLTNSVVDEWKKLGKYIIEANTTESFTEWSLDVFMEGSLLNNPSSGAVMCSTSGLL